MKTTVIKSFSSTDHGTTCAKCGEPLIAPEWSEFVTEELVLNLWSCMSCGNRFETEACMPADVEADAEAIKDFFPIAVGCVNQMDSWALGSSERCFLPA